MSVPHAHTLNNFTEDWASLKILCVGQDLGLHQIVGIKANTFSSHKCRQCVCSAKKT